MNVALSADERSRLLQVAREAISEHVAGRRLATPVADGVLARRQGVFVSLHRHGDLRGCIGYPDGGPALADTVPRASVAAASADDRFAPVTAAELPEIDIEISVLTPVEPVTDPSTIQIGRDGLIVEQRGHRGLLLPQVAVEWGWDLDAFVSQTCLKAGLPRDAWKRGASLYRFQADVFGDRA
ncbi:MAG: AmmeMemoRadiSam system protein A [Acidobacteriota bacterium]